MKQRVVPFALFLCMILPAVMRAEGFNVGDTVFREPFQALSDDWTISDPAYVSLGEGVVQVSLPIGGAAKNASLTRPLPIEDIVGTRLRISARVKAEGVDAPPNPWNGVKVMLVLDLPEGKRWLQQNNVYGTFDWKTIRFSATVPRRATGATLVLGLENTTGKVRIDDLEVTVVGKRRLPVPEQGPENRPVYTEDGLNSALRGRSLPTVYKGHDLPRLRGAMISPGRFGPEDIKVLAGDWKANHVRWQFTWAGFPNGPADTATVEQYDRWIEQQCLLLDAMLPECEKYGVRVCLDLHTPPGGRMPREEGGMMRLFHDPKWQDAFVAVWERLARRYKDAPAIWGYDLLNEPVEGDRPDDVRILNWRELALKTSKAVRAVDPHRAIILEADPWGGPESLDWFEPFDPAEVPNVVYSVHMYVPHSFTHQGVHREAEAIEYPGEIRGKMWNKETLREALRVPREFARDYGVAIYIGEFSAIRWAPGDSAYRYLKDCIEIFEEEGWDWAYHAFREWDGWSAEHGPDKEDHHPATEPTDREKLLRSWFEKNRR